MSAQQTSQEQLAHALRDIKAGMEVVQAIADAIRELGSVLSGVLYSQVMDSLSLRDYTFVIDLLKDAGLVRETAYQLHWVGPPAEA